MRPVRRPARATRRPRRPRSRTRRRGLIATSSSMMILLLLPTAAVASTVSDAPPHGRRPKPRRRTIVGGTETVPRRYPYMASLAASFTGSHKCGGALIAPDVVLTAAHCLGYFTSIELNRHDTFDETELYESYVIEREVPHPEFKVENVQDDYDFALAKFYGRTELEPVKINRNASSPSVEGEEMLVFGWGSTVPDVSSVMSGVLMEVTINYVPYDVCVDAWKANAYLVSDAVICASDEGEDSCNGDSGGPLIEYDPSDDDASGDVLVGLVSSGASICADPTKPGLYARVSAVWDWIRETVCELSYDPPDDFDCPSPSVIATPPPSERINVTVEIQFDSYPEETGYVVQSTSKLTGVTTLVRHRPIFTYRNDEDFSTIRETFEVTDDAEYDFVMLDRLGDGMYSGARGYYRIYYDDGGGEEISLINETKFWTFDASQTSTFVLGLPDTLEPTSSPVPTASVVPTPTPLPYVTLVIQFDKYPREIGHTLERILPRSTSATNGAEEETEIIEYVPTGTYRADKYKFSLQTIIIELRPKTSVDQLYRFNITDVEGDGLCCKYGDGYWQLWLGPANATEGGGMMLGTGTANAELDGTSGLSVEFVLEGFPTETPTGRPSQVPSESPTPPPNVQARNNGPTAPSPPTSSSSRGRGTIDKGSLAIFVVWTSLLCFATCLATNI